MPEERRISPVVAIIPIGLGLAAVAGIAALAFAAPPVPPPPPGKANLYGKVTDSVTGSPVPGVLVGLDTMETLTDGAGNYLFDDLEPGGYVLQFSKEGYEPVVY